MDRLPIDRSTIRGIIQLMVAPSSTKRLPQVASLRVMYRRFTRPFRNRVLLAIWFVIVSTAVFLPAAMHDPLFVDENFYAWSGYYFATRLAHFDFSAPSVPDRLDPGWDPQNWWSVCAPLGFRLGYGGAMMLLHLAPPAEPYDLSLANVPQPGAQIPLATLQTLRGLAAIASSFGLAVLAYRFGIGGAIGAAIVLIVGGLDLTRIMAEPLLVLSLGLSVLTFGSPLFAIAVALAVSSKLTALLLVPLMLWPKAVGMRPGVHFVALPMAAIAWTILNPQSWFAGGPLYLYHMLLQRQMEQVEYSTAFMHGGLYLPPRYLIPFIYLAVWLLCAIVHRHQAMTIGRLSRAGVGN